MKKLLFIAAILFAFPAFAWDGVDQDTGQAIFIGKGNKCRAGNTITIHVDGVPRPALVVSIYSQKPDTILIFEDSDGRQHTAVMDGYAARKAKKAAK